MLIQQIVAYLLAGVLVTGGTSVTDIQDVPQDHWSHPYVSYMVEHEIMYTTKAGHFLGEAQINRGDFVRSLWLAAGSPEGAQADFTDVRPEDPCYQAVGWAVEQGITQGTDATTFSPAAYLDREQAFTFLWRALPVFGVEQREGLSGGLAEFQDVDAVSNWALTAIGDLYDRGIVSGNGEGALAPQDPVTRSETATLLYKTMHLEAGSEGGTEPAVPTTTTDTDAPMADWSWFDDAVFVGDSVSLKLTGYVTKMRKTEPDYLGKAQFLTAGSLGSGNALWEVSDQSVHPLYQGTKMRLEDSIHACGAKKLYILLGMNDVGMYGVDDSAANMETLLKLIQEKTPDLEIFVQSATPIHKGNEKKVLNNANLRAYNEKLKEMCQRNGYHYVDVAPVLTDEEGYLPSAYCSDASGMGMHFTDEACRIWVDYLRQDAAARQAE